MHQIRLRALQDPADRALVAGFYRRSADYVLLETGTLPDEGTTEAFFTGAPAAHDPRGDLREGAFHGRELIGICELAFDLPGPGAALISLMILAPAWRGEGLGALWTARLTGLARARGMRCLGLSVLHSNPRARRFWLRQGFRPGCGSAAGPGRDRLVLDLRLPLAAPRPERGPAAVTAGLPPFQAVPDENGPGETPGP